MEDLRDYEVKKVNIKNHVRISELRNGVRWDEKIGENLV